MKVTTRFFTTTAWTRTAKSALTVIAVAALLATGPKAYGGVLFVDVNDADCADAGDNLYCQIQDAVDDAVEGDNIQVREGTYDPIVIDTDNITIQGIGGGEVIIDAAGLPGGSAVTLNADGVTLRRLTVENAVDVARVGGHGFLVTGNANELHGNTARDNARMGFDVRGDFNSFSANKAHGNVNGFNINGNSNTLNANTCVGNNNGYVLSVADSNTLRGNLAEGNSFRGFFLVFLANNTLLEGNTARDNGFSGFIMFAFANSNTLRGNRAEGNGTAQNPADNFGYVLALGCNDNTVQGNSAVDNVGEGFAVANSSGNTVQGNTAVSNGESGFLLVDQATLNTFRSNTARDNGGDGFSVLNDGELATDLNAFENNTSMQNAGWGFFVDAVLSNTFANNNCKFNDLGGANLPGICD